MSIGCFQSDILFYVYFKINYYYLLRSQGKANRKKEIWLTICDPTISGNWTVRDTRVHFKKLKMQQHLFEGVRQWWKCVVISLLWKILTLTLQSCPFKSAHKLISSVVHTLLSSVRRCAVMYVSQWLTDGAVFTRPALVAVTLALPADSMVDAAWVTVPLLTFWSCPAFLALTHTTDAWSVGTTVHHTDLCGERKSHGDMLLLYREKAPFLLVLDLCIFVCWVDASATAEKYSNGCCKAAMPLNKVGKLSWTKQDEFSTLLLDATCKKIPSREI